MALNSFTKKAAETNEEQGRLPTERSVEELIQFGVVNIDKPPGPTSHQVSDFVQKILKIKKAGHGGSLDPKVTGVLPVALQNASRLSQLMLKGGKEYVGILHLHKEADEKAIKKAIQKFTGKIKQIPPVRSAVKRQLRTREIYDFEMLEITEKNVLFRVSCEAGTYIRKLCHDIGLDLGVGGNMAALRRIRASLFKEDTLVTLQDLQDAYTLWKKEGNEKYIRHCIHPAEKMVEHIPKVWVFDTTIKSICHGRDVFVPGISKLTEMEVDQVVAIMSLKGELIALGKAVMTHTKVMNENKGNAVKTTKVFMDSDTYAH
jgi:H/ACA ribonucleoprotein complex subunit 4